MSNILVVLNDPPYGTERSYNGLRLAGSLGRKKEAKVRVFLIGDAVGCAKRGQKVPQGYYNIESMLQIVVRHGGEVGVCGSCLDARGTVETDLVEGTHRGSMDELTAWTLEADKVVSF
ncbi:MAG: DsrE family protein [Acidobacteriota bacterium]